MRPAVRDWFDVMNVRVRNFRAVVVCYVTAARLAGVIVPRESLSSVRVPLVGVALDPFLGRHLPRLSVQASV
jgi:hypothetical protein